MRKIDKTSASILSLKYKSWIDSIIAKGKKGSKSYNIYYDDIAMNLYRCQFGVCAYTEMPICIPELYETDNWEKGRYVIPNSAAYCRLDHLGEMDHYDPENKKDQYWDWDNLFMIHAKINSIKTNTKVVPYLKPDLTKYSPSDYFDYDDKTHRFVPNTDIEDEDIRKEIQSMIDNVLCMNHGVVKNERRDYINLLKNKKAKGEAFIVDRFFTSVAWSV